MENEGLIFDIRRFSVHDGPGIRTTVFFKGCPLSCWWCHNPESQEIKSEATIKTFKLSGKSFQHPETIGKFMSVDEVMREVIRDRIFYEESQGGVTFSGGEPMMQEGFLLDLLKAAKYSGLHTALDTSGYSSLEAMQHISPWVDLFLFDLKLIENKLHQRYTGVSNIPILANLRYLVQNKYRIILRFPVIPGITNTKKNISEMKVFIQSLVPCHPLTIDLLPFHDSARNKYCRLLKVNKVADLIPLKPENLHSLAAEFESLGMKVRIGG